MNAQPRKTLLIVSQTFVPDPASVGQHIADVAIEMARRGHPVRVYTSARGYEDPSIRYPLREDLKGIDIRRLPLASFGKKSIFTRVLGTASFMAQTFFRGLFTPHLGGIFFSTSPPLVGVIATLIHWLRGVPIAYWAMDLNPDQLIALKKLKSTDPAARLLEAVNRLILRESALIIALDRFMADRLQARLPTPCAGLGPQSSVPSPQHSALSAQHFLIMPPWPHETHVEPVVHADNAFRIRHGLQDKRVVMYSGNHSPSNPLDTLLQAMRKYRDDPNLRFAFIGGGIGKKAVEAFIRQHDLSNAICLPYQPLSELRYSLAAADVHVVSLGQEMVGIIHPCKIYGAMAVGRPIFYLGPRPSHISDLLDAHAFGWHAAHGDIAAAEAALDQIRAADPAALKQMGEIALKALPATAGQDLLCGRLCDALERALRLPARR